MPKRQWRQRNGKRRWTRLRALRMPRHPRLLANLVKAEIVSDANARPVVDEILRTGKLIAKTRGLAASVRHPDATANPLRTDSGVNAGPTISVRDRSGDKRNNPALSNLRTNPNQLQQRRETNNWPGGDKNLSQSRFKTARNWRPLLARYWDTSSLL